MKIQQVEWTLFVLILAARFPNHQIKRHMTERPLQPELDLALIAVLGSLPIAQTHVRTCVYICVCVDCRRVACVHVHPCGGCALQDEMDTDKSGYLELAY